MALYSAEFNGDIWLLVLNLDVVNSVKMSSVVQEKI
jgi:hypothetical protein